MMDVVGRRVYRVQWERWLHVAIFGAFTVALLFMADDGAHGPGSAGIAALIVGYVMVALGCVLIIRSARIAVVTTDNELMVRGIFRTRRFTIAEIDEVTLEGAQGRLRLRSGRTVRLWHLQRANPVIVRGIQSADMIVDSLNRDLTERRLHSGRRPVAK
jgi:hypothetical protein